VLVTDRVCVPEGICQRAAEWRVVQRAEMDTSTMNVIYTLLSGTFLTTVELRSRGLSNTDEWKDHGNILVEGPRSYMRTIVKTHRKINRVGGKGKGKVHPRTGHEGPDGE
jgi:hypothetical protein